MSIALTFAAFYDYDPAGLGIDVPLTLRSGALSADVRAKIDCGSTYCVFRRITGIRLGFDIERGIPQWIGTAMGDFLTYGHEASLNVLGIETVATVYFAADEHFPVNLLGRVGWLDRMRLGLIDHDGRLYLSAYDDPI